jgi:hypothetical protein
MYKLLLAAPVQHPFLTSAIVAAGLASAAPIEPRSPHLGLDARLSALEMTTGSVIQRAVLDATPDEGAQYLHPATALAEVIGRAREWLSSGPDQRQENVPLDVATFPDSDAPEAQSLVSAAEPETPIVIVPEAEPVVSAVIPDEAVPVATTAPAPSSSPSDLTSRELFLNKAEELLRLGDLSGARLFFQRAADLGDARGAVGLGSTFDPKVLRALNVYGVRPDQDQANYWYARARQLEMTSAGR